MDTESLNVMLEELDTIPIIESESDAKFLVKMDEVRILTPRMPFTSEQENRIINLHNKFIGKKKSVSKKDDTDEIKFKETVEQTPFGVSKNSTPIIADKDLAEMTVSLENFAGVQIIGMKKQFKEDWDFGTGNVNSDVDSGYFVKVLVTCGGQSREGEIKIDEVMFDNILKSTGMKS